MLPEVISTIEQTSHYHVNLDELMEKVGERLAQLLQVEWGMVTAGAAAAATHSIAGIIAGADPEKMQRLPNLEGPESAHGHDPGAGTHFGKAKFGLPEVAPIAKKAGVPIFIDAAADYLIMSHAQGRGYSFVIRPAAMKQDEYKKVAAIDQQASHGGACGGCCGRWDVEVQYQVGAAKHKLLKSDTLVFHRNTCDTDWSPASQELTGFRKQFSKQST